MRRGALALVAAMVAAGCAGGGGAGTPEQDPGEFITELVHHVAAGRYAQAWTTMYPPHQKVATRAEYVRCEPLTPFPGTIDAVDVLEVFDEPVTVPGEAKQLDSKAIRVRLTVTAEDATDRFDSTFHAVAFDGRWTWILPETRYAAYLGGGCLTDS